MDINNIRKYNDLNALLELNTGFKIVSYSAKEKGVYGTYVVASNELDRLPLGVFPNSCDVFAYENSLGIELPVYSITISLPKNIDKLGVNDIVDRVIKKVNKDNVYESFSNKFAELLKVRGFKGVSVYPTTYGIGVWNMLSFGREKFDIDEVRALLDSVGLEYSNEYSDSRWVYRFKISRKVGNIEKLESFINNLNNNV